MTPKQLVSKEDRHSLRLVPPLAEEFWVYGNAATVDRAREWALGRRYLLAAGIPKCAHGLYLLANCPGIGCRNHFRQLDHVNVWVPASFIDERPFLLCHPYSDQIDDDTRAYAAAHGLEVSSKPYLDDGWYGCGSLPIRLEIPQDWPMWPIEAKALVLSAGQPIAWPDPDPLPGGTA